MFQALSDGAFRELIMESKRMELLLKLFIKDDGKKLEYKSVIQQVSLEKEFCLLNILA